MNLGVLLGTFFLPADQQHDHPASESNYEGLAYLGEYPLSWAACMANETIYNLLLDRGADPDSQDSFGNTVLHMAVVTNQMVRDMFIRGRDKSRNRGPLNAKYFLFRGSIQAKIG